MDAASRRTCCGRPDLLGVHAQVSEELLRVSGGIAGFSGLYYAVAVLTDATYRAGVPRPS